VPCTPDEQLPPVRSAYARAVVLLSSKRSRTLRQKSFRLLVGCGMIGSGSRFTSTHCPGGCAMYSNHALDRALHKEHARLARHKRAALVQSSSLEPARVLRVVWAALLGLLLG